MVFAYTRSVIDEYDSTEQQLDLIKRYCSENKIEIDGIYSDRKTRCWRLSGERDRARTLGLESDYTDPELEKMLIEVMKVAADIEVLILVDTKLKLAGYNEEHKRVFNRILEKENVHIEEVGIRYESNGKGICIYHATIGGLKRPRILIRNLDYCYKYAYDNKLLVSGMLVDTNSHNRKSYQVMKVNIEKNLYEGILVYSTYLLTRKINVLAELLENVGKIYSVREGKLAVCNINDYKACRLNALAIYDSVFNEYFPERMEWFCKYRVLWNLEISLRLEDFYKKDIKGIDIILLEKYSDVATDVCRFLELVKNIGMICNVKEGRILVYERKGSLLCKSIDSE